MKLSVITIVYNDIKNIEKTISSVLNQTYKNIEYIIIDGASTDGTVEIIQKYSENITFWSSESDEGLYYAMNKGLKKATGDYICFLNSGDLFFDKHTVNNILSVNSDKEIDIIYGETIIIDEDGNIKGKRRLSAPQKLDWRSFKNGMLVSHQAFIPSKKLATDYNLNYRFSSDFDWCIRIMKQADNIVNVNQTIIRYLDGGLTKKRLIKSLKERFKIMIKYYGFITTIYIHIKNGLKFLIFVIRKKWF
jgi:glycosyltransferase involved in cell wall biosynthesis